MKSKVYGFTGMAVVLGMCLLLQGCPTGSVKPDFDAQPTDGPAPLQVVFTDASYSEEGAITGWLWDFGDGTTSAEQEPGHTYVQPGSYDVKLTVTVNGRKYSEFKRNFIRVEGCLDPAQADIASPVMKSIPEVTFTQSKHGNNTHTVKLSSYQISTFEITNAEFCGVLNWALGRDLIDQRDFLVYDKADFPLVSVDSSDELRSNIYFDDVCGVYSVMPGFQDYPVVSVTWYGAVSFCNWLSLMKGKTPCYNLEDWSLDNPFSGGYRLPSESEWECAAAVKLSTDGKVYEYKYAIGADGLVSEQIELQMNIRNYYDGVTPVGYFNGNNGTLVSHTPFGCYDMCGNVAEWCGDWWTPLDYYRQCREVGTVTNPLGPEEDPGNGERAIRGESWRAPGVAATSSREGVGMTFMKATVGFRVVKSS